MNKVDLTVIICCYNSSTRIQSTLEHLAQQELFGLKAELILVDNNCSDETVVISENLWTYYKKPYPLRILNETNPGLSFARKKGVLGAKGDIVIFCDDDNWLEKSYLFNAFQIMNCGRNIGVLAGQSFAISDVEIPNWFYTNYGLYACGVLALESGDVTSRKWVWGAGMVVRKKVMLEIYSRFKHIATDRKGNDLSSGGDVEICMWHVLSGFKLWYSDKLSIKHYMPFTRLEVSMAKRQFDAQLNSCKKLSKLEKLVDDYLLWTNTPKIYIIEITLELFRFNLYGFFKNFYNLLILLKIMPNRLILSAYKIKSLFRFHTDEIR